MRSKLESLVEKLAELEHEQWVHWSKALAMQESISEVRRKRWEKYWVPYSDLPEDVKESDRKWARRVLEIILDELGGLEDEDREGYL